MRSKRAWRGFVNHIVRGVLMRRFFWFAIVGLAALASAPAHAAGLLQDLFASFERRSAPVVYRYAPAQPQMRFVYDEGFRVSRRAVVRKHVTASRKAGLRAGMKATGMKSANAPTGEPAKIEFEGLNPRDATTAAIARDPTLRVGDAYMTPQGLRIYRGRTSAAGKGAFVGYRDAGIDQDAKNRLSAIERQHIPRGDAAPRVIATSTYATNQSTSARTALDPNGRAIRIVGP